MLGDGDKGGNWDNCNSMIKGGNWDNCKSINKNI